MTDNPDFTNPKSKSSDVSDMKLKSNLRDVLYKREMSASELARATKLPKQTINDWLNGSSPKNLNQLKIVADYFGVSIDQLVFGEAQQVKPMNAIEEFVDNEIYAGKYEVILRRIVK